MITATQGGAPAGLEHYERTRLEKFRLAVEVILELATDEALPAPLESELYIFRDRVQQALLLPEAAADLIPWRKRGEGVGSGESG